MEKKKKEITEKEIGLNLNELMNTFITGGVSFVVASFLKSIFVEIALEKSKKKKDKAIEKHNKMLV